MDSLLLARMHPPRPRPSYPVDRALARALAPLLPSALDAGEGDVEAARQVMPVRPRPVRPWTWVLAVAALLAVGWALAAFLHATPGW